MLDRRGFLKFIGGAAVGTLATPVVWKGLDDISIWSQNWPWIPSLQYGNHENTYVRTVSKLCPAAGATKIRLVGGRPVRAPGFAHGVSLNQGPLLLSYNLLIINNFLKENIR